MSGRSSPGDLGPGAGVGAAALGVEQDRPSQRVSAEPRIGTRQYLHRSHRLFRDEIPVHRVGEELVQPDPVLEHAETLRGTEDGRSGEATVEKIGLERVRLGVSQVNPGRAPPEEIRERRRVDGFHLFGPEDLEGCRDALGRFPDPGKGRAADDPGLLDFDPLGSRAPGDDAKGREETEPGSRAAERGSERGPAASRAAPFRRRKPQSVTAPSEAEETSFAYFAKTPVV